MHAIPASAPYTLSPAMFLLELPDDLYQEMAAMDRYRTYLRENQHAFPPNAFAFASAPWHYDFDCHESPHDAWVESVELSEYPVGEDRRLLDIRVRLLGAYHDGHIQLHYQNVLSYALTSPAEYSMPPLGVAHGD